MLCYVHRLVTISTRCVRICRCAHVPYRRIDVVDVIPWNRAVCENKIFIHSSEYPLRLHLILYTAAALICAQILFTFRSDHYLIEFCVWNENNNIKRGNQ